MVNIFFLGLILLVRGEYSLIFLSSPIINICISKSYFKDVISIHTQKRRLLGSFDS